MFNFFFPNNEGGNCKDSSFFSSYPLNTPSLLLKAFIAETWLGRGVYFISAMTSSLPFILPIVQVVHYIFVSNKFDQLFPSVSNFKPSKSNSPSPSAPFKSPSASKFSDDDDIFDGEEDDKEFNLSKGGGFDEKLDKWQWSDEDFAKELQEEWDGDDEALARKLQENYFDEYKEKNDPALDDDEEFARKLQDQLFAEDAEQKNYFYTDNSKISDTQTQNQLSTDKADVETPPVLSPSEVETDLEKTEKLLKQEEATHQILSTPGIVGYLKKDENDPSAEPLTLYTLQTGLFRAVAAAVTRTYPQAMSPAALRAQRDVNFEQYLILKMKQFGHIEEVQGIITLPSGKQFALEGYVEEFIAPAVIASYETFAQTSSMFKSKDKAWIFSQFDQMFFSDYVSEKEVDCMVTTLQDPSFVGPLALQGGFIDHCAAFIWVGNYLIYADRSGIHTQPGTYVLRLPNRELLTEEFINELVKREDLNEDNYHILEKFLSELNATVVHYEYRPSQKVGNCTHATMETVLNDFMAIRELLNANGGNWNKINDKSWQSAFDKVRLEFDRWSAYEKQVIFDDIVSEIEEWLSQKTDISAIDLKKTYQELLTCWLYTPNVERDPVKEEKVQKLLEALS